MSGIAVEARAARHVQVEHEHRRLVAEHGALSGVDVAGLGHDLDVVLGLEQHAQAGAHDRMIVGEHDRDRAFDCHRADRTVHTRGASWNMARSMREGSRCAIGSGPR